MRAEILCCTGLAEEGILGYRKLTSRSGQVMSTSTRVIGCVSSLQFSSLHNMSILCIFIRLFVNQFPFVYLDFGFDKHIYNVLEVNKTSYENCIDTDFIHNITRGGRDVFQFLEVRPYYFLSGRGFCFQGMRVAINVEEIAPVPQSAVPNKTFSSSKMSHIKMFVLLATTLTWTFILQRH